MPDLFSPNTLKDATLRNRIVMSPRTMYRSPDGLKNDFHVMLKPSRAAGGFGLIFPEQLVIQPDGRTTPNCSGSYDDAQIPGVVEEAKRLRDEVCIPVGVSWTLGVPAEADRVIRKELVGLIFLGRPALSNPHWPVWAARELRVNDPCALVSENWGWWLRNFRGHDAAIGWPIAAARRWCALRRVRAAAGENGSANGWTLPAQAHITQPCSGVL